MTISNVAGNLYVYVYDTSTLDWKEIEGINTFKILKKQNQMSNFEINIPNLDDTQKAYVKEFAQVLFFSGTTLILKGRIQNISYQTAYEATITGNGMEVAINDHTYTNNTRSPEDPDRVEYNNVSAQTIYKELLSKNSDGTTPWLMTPANSGLYTADYGIISMRFEYADNLTAIGNLSNAIDYNWWVSQDGSYNDSFNLASTQGVQTTPSGYRVFNISGSSQNCDRTDYQKDVSNFSNSVSVIGYGDGNNQLSTYVYNSSTTYSFLTATDTSLSADITSSATTINVVSTTGFASTGTIQIGLEKITYTGITSTSFTGCTRGASSTTAVAHYNLDHVLNLTQINLSNASSFASSGTVIVAEEQITYTGKSTNTLTGVTRGANSTTASLHRTGCYVQKYVAVASAEALSSIGKYGEMDITLPHRDIRDLSTLELIATNELINRMNPIERITLEPSDPMSTAENVNIGDLVSITDAESSLSSNYNVVSITYEANYGVLDITLEASNRSLTFIEQMQKQRQDTLNLAKYMQGATNVYVVNNTENCDNGYGNVIKTYIPNETVAVNAVKLSYGVEAYRIYNTTTANESAHTHGIPSLTVNGSTTTSTNISHTHTVTIPSHTHTVYATTANPSGDTMYLNTDSGGSPAHTHGFPTGMVGYNHTHDISSDTTSSGGSSTPTSASGGGSHSHSVNGSTTTSDTTSAGSAHNHGVAYGISTGSNTVSDIQIFIDGTDRTAAIESAIGHTLTVNSTENEIDLSSWLTSVGQWHTIEIRPNGTCRIVANAWIKLFIEST